MATIAFASVVEMRKIKRNKEELIYAIYMY